MKCPCWGWRGVSSIKISQLEFLLQFTLALHPPYSRTASSPQLKSSLHNLSPGHSQHSSTHTNIVLSFPYSAARAFLFSLTRNLACLICKHNFCLDVPMDEARDWKAQLRTTALSQAFSEAKEVWQTQQQLPGHKAKAIPHIPEQKDNTRAGPVTSQIPLPWFCGITELHKAELWVSAALLYPVTVQGYCQII